MRAHEAAYQRHQPLNSPFRRGNKTLGLATTSTNTNISALVQALGADSMAKVDADKVKWEGSPYYNIRHSWNQTKGTLVGETTARFIFEQAGLEVSSATVFDGGMERLTSSFDLNVTKLGRVEVKLATEGVDGRFSWGTMSPTLADHFMLLGVTPKEVRGWLVPGEALNRLMSVKSRGVSVNGLRYAQGSYSIAVPAGAEPQWLSPYGGPEDVLMDRIGRESRRRHRS